MSQNLLNATLTDRRDITDDLAFLKIQPDAGLGDFEPGQFITLGLPLDPEPEEAESPQDSGGGTASKRRGRVRMLRRSYSVGSASNVKDHAELYVVRVQDGALTTQLWDMPLGSRLWVSPRCVGELTLKDVEPQKKLVMIGTGTGAAPYVSMLRSYRGMDRWDRFVLIHGTRYARDLGYHDELSRIAAEDPSVVYLPSVTREPDDSGWSGLRGRVQQVVESDALRHALNGELDPATCEVFLCGNPEMIDTMEPALHERGFVTRTIRQPGNLHLERYW